jgi:tRNA threonylcarbamoyladenosine biosynthesis protein TsaE
MQERRLTSDSAEATRRIAKTVGGRLQGGERIALDGDLGSGKTTFVQGLAQALGVLEPVTSPTFVLVREYRTGRLPLVHSDLYRLNSPAEFQTLGLDDVDPESVVVVEWPERVPGLVESVDLVIQIASTETGRTVVLRAVTEAGGRLLGNGACRS